MNYTNLVLFALGLLGMLLHNLVELNKLNKASNGNVNLGQYLKLEKFAILINVIVVFVAVMVKSEIKQIEQAGKWLGVAFVAIGYMGQSLLIFVMGKAQKSIDSGENKNP